MDFRKYSSVIRNITLISQLGLSLITPLLICLFFCFYLHEHTGIGGWIYIPGFFLGLGSSATVFYKLYLAITGAKKKEKKEEIRSSFNHHV